jgi:hypothetical protein
MIVHALVFQLQHSNFYMEIYPPAFQFRNLNEYFLVTLGFKLQAHYTSSCTVWNNV